jgi:hypothetical protein
MNRKRLFYLVTMISGILLAGCGNSEKPAGITTAIEKKTLIMDPFRYHKLIEVSPGQDYDIVSWGRGSATSGAFAILHSDSAAAKYTTTTGDLAGSITDVYNSDMDLDGNPEILIQAKGKDSINYTNIYAFEFTNGRAEKLDFPKLTRSQKQGYRGNDNFYIKDGILFREFPVYNGNGKDAKATGQKRQLQYGLRNNSFTVKQLSKDSTNVNGLKPVMNTPEKTTSQVSTKRVKKHTIVKKHKKKRRRRVSDEG